ncbi:unnamed protein product [Ilex paraguariensis]|uniref:Hexosyltransferase n=1 Tax=Ilex paraguariensis TaxID=185542 RepID=A0ABC8QUY2_9AQUA
MSPALSAAIRGMIDCWVPIKLEEATGLVIRFVIGRTSDKSKMTEHRKEVAEYDDFMLLDIEEYSKLPYKTLAYFKAAYAIFDSEFYVKADDDIYLRPGMSHYHICLGRSTFYMLMVQFMLFLLM